MTLWNGLTFGGIVAGTTIFLIGVKNTLRSIQTGTVELRQKLAALVVEVTSIMNGSTLQHLLAQQPIMSG